MARPERLIYTGEVINGVPQAFFLGVPARDLDEADIAALSDEQLAACLGGPMPLYVEPERQRKSTKGEG